MFKPDDLNAIDAAISSGQLTVRMNGREVVYRSIAELKLARRHIYRELFKKKGKRRSALEGIVTCGDRGIR